MPELREVYDRVTEQRPAGPGALDRQRERQQRSLRNRKLGTIGLSAALLVVAILVVVLIGTDETDPGKRTNQPADQSALPSERGAYLFDLETGQTTEVPGIEAQGSVSPGIAVSPDGRMIAYRGTDPEGMSVLYVANLDGSNIRPLEHTARAGLGPVGPEFSPDGSQIVYQAKGSANFGGDVFVVDVVSGETTRLTHLDPVHSTMWYMGPHFSPDGEAVYFTLPSGDLVTKRWDLWSVAASGGTPHLVLRGAIGGRISPDGQMIVYFEYAPSPGLLGDMWLADADGSNPQRVPGVQGDVFSARWSPDGTRIAYTEQASKSAYVVDLTTGEVTRVLQDITERFPEWVDDHTWIVGES